jgi:hypothetical protein
MHNHIVVDGSQILSGHPVNVEALEDGELNSAS